ncbi:MAG: UvrB/UvrC motif-containing protein [Polyangiaceae bacterium]|nr:UvrB/UvrC motif-containing protein [Polyangiaceae bacterium]
MMLRSRAPPPARRKARPEIRRRRPGSAEDRGAPDEHEAKGSTRGEQRETARWGPLYPSMRAEMFTAAENLEFERAAKLRDEIKRLEALAGDSSSVDAGDIGYDPYTAAPKRKSAKTSRTSRASPTKKTGARGRWKR